MTLIELSNKTDNSLKIARVILKLLRIPYRIIELNEAEIKKEMMQKIKESVLNRIKEEILNDYSYLERLHRRLLL